MRFMSNRFDAVKVKWSNSETSSTHPLKNMGKDVARWHFVCAHHFKVTDLRMGSAAPFGETKVALY